MAGSERAYAVSLSRGYSQRELFNGAYFLMKAISLAYHDVTDGADHAGSATLYKLAPRSFHDHLLSIRQQPGEIAVRSLERFCRWGGSIPVFLTFDDGELGAYKYIADELEQHGWRGHFFIITDRIGRSGFLDRRQIRDLRSRGHVIGSHSCSHPERMSHLTWGQLMSEWSDSCAILSDILGEPVRVASVPNGYYSRGVGEAAAAAGIEVLFTSEATAVTSVLNGCLTLGRYFIQTHTPPEVSGAIAAGRIWPRWRQELLWGAKKPLKWLAGESYLAIRRYLIRRALPDLKPRHRAWESSRSLGADINKRNGEAGPATDK
jgi:peptidoglycan/xylan/chitin deacetylase (PgdA/CDA1 family)